MYVEVLQLLADVQVRKTVLNEILTDSGELMTLEVHIHFVKVSLHSQLNISD